MPESDPSSIAIELAERIAAEVIRREPDWNSVSSWARDLVVAVDAAGANAPPPGG